MQRNRQANDFKKTAYSAPRNIVYRDPGSLSGNPRNARRHSTAQIAKIARSIERFGFNNPVLVDGKSEILCGHGRVEAAKLLALSSIPTLRLDHMSEAARRAYVLADNKLSDESDFDRALVAIELEELLALDPGFEITDIGFDVPEIDVLINELHEEETDEVAPPQIGTVPAVARRGDLWALGKHFLFCGDALDEMSYHVLMGAARAQMVITDPPFNCKIQGHVSGLGKAQHNEFAMASGEMSDAQFRDFLSAALRHMARFSLPGSLHFIFQDWRQLGNLLAAAAPIYSEQKNLCVWNKGQGSMGALWRSQHELVGVFKVGAKPHVNNVQLGRHGRNRTNVWTYRGMAGFQKDRDKKLAQHPTIKPIALIADAILDCSNPGDVIFDGFAGSGTLLIACERTNRRGFAIELDPRYVDVALHRFRQATAMEPVNLWTGAKLPPRSVKAQLL